MSASLYWRHVSPPASQTLGDQVMFAIRDRRHGETDPVTLNCDHWWSYFEGRRDACASTSPDAAEEFQEVMDLLTEYGAIEVWEER